MDSILENFRILHEERERLVDEMVQELLHKKTSQKEEINSGHRFRNHLARYTECSRKLVELYEDKDEIKRDEIAAISGSNEFAEFYGRIRAAKEFHRRFPDVIDTLGAEFAHFKRAREKRLDDETLVTFTDEESYGKFLDLHQIYLTFLNIPKIRTDNKLGNLTYLEFIIFVENLHEIGFEIKNSSEYEDFVTIFHDYLLDFIKRAKPLLDIEKEVEECGKRFENQWSCGDASGWPMHLLNSIHQACRPKPSVDQLVDFEKYDSEVKLEELGMDQLRDILQVLGLKCGGSLSERANRLFSLKTHTIEELDHSFFPNKKKKTVEDEFLTGFVTTYRKLDEYKELALKEAQISHYLEILKDTLALTVDNVERRQARTAEEIDFEEEVDPSKIENDVKSDDEDFEDQSLYNPKNLPLDFDGKPIPYWLYKLHGLNIYYNCEICGNSKYRGPKAFQRHFGEWRHAHGMRCLGIPNTAHFVNVTKIQDAYNLWDVIKNNKQKEQWTADIDEEFEDTDGNPINKKIFDDMKRQGLL